VYSASSISPFGVFGLIDLAAGEPLVQGAQRICGPGATPNGAFSSTTNDPTCNEVEKK
jgi:hypothetical protein